MTHRIEHFRFRLAEWLADFDTRLLEIALAGSCFINASLAVGVDANGAPLAPNLFNSLRWLSRDPSNWAAALVMLGGFILISLGIGTRRVDDTRPRALAMLLAMSFYIAITFSTYRGGEIFALRYAWTAALAFFASLVLIVESMVRKAERKLEPGLEWNHCLGHFA